MKKVNHVTDYVLIKGYTTSEWDTCEFAIIHITKEWKAEMQTRLQRIAAFKDDHSFYSHVYWDAPEGYFSKLISEDEDYSIIDDILNDYEEWCFITITENELQCCSLPENKLDTHQLCITKNGLAHFRAYGKHTGEEFYTGDFNIAVIIDVKGFLQTTH